jgi:hypothetical protein
MTVFSNFSFLITSKSTTNNLTTMKAIALMVFLLLFFISTLVHADHLAAEAIAIEQQDCHICNQGIDTPAELPQIDVVVVTRYNLVTQAISTTDFSLNSFVQPPLRAPPFPE